MKINVVNLKSELVKFNKLIEDYEEIFLNLYNQISSSSIYWDDNISKEFFLNVDTEKLQVKNTIVELTEIKKVYEELINRYEDFGNKIQIKIKVKNIILSKFDNYLDKLYEIIECYHGLDLDFCPNESKALYSHMGKLLKIGNDTLELKEKVKKQFEAIEGIERLINLKVSKIKIEYIKETQINKFI